MPNYETISGMSKTTIDYSELEAVVITTERFASFALMIEDALTRGQDNVEEYMGAVNLFTDLMLQQRRKKQELFDTAKPQT